MQQPRATRGRTIHARIVLMVLAVLLVGCTDQGGTAQPASTAPSPAPADQAGAAAGLIPDLVRRVEPSVVTIFTKGGLGSGVVWSADGVIVTNHHVIAGNDQVEVAFADGRRVGGRVRASDPLTDLAVVEADREGLPAATFQKALPRVGDLAIAIGSPLGFENTVTSGIISGLHREIPGSARDGQALVDLIQTDAAISPGNSGGALVNARGEVIGINDAYIPPSAGAVALGFAIPGATVVDVVTQLLETGRARHAFIGIQPAQVTAEIARQLGLDQTDGVLVLETVSGGPAARAGIRPGDVIRAVDGKQTASVEDFFAALRARKPGDTVPVTLIRDGRQQDVNVTLAERPVASS
jgi:serine protease DegQ